MRYSADRCQLGFYSESEEVDADVSFKQVRPFYLTGSLWMLCGSGLESSEREMLN